MATNTNPSRPTMFPCATQVSLIQVGADDSDLKVINKQQGHYNRSSLTWSSAKDTDAQLKGVKKPVIKRVSEGLSFTNEVIRDMAPYTIPYNEQSIYDAYDTSEFLSQAEKKMKYPGGRFNNYGPDCRHMSCHFKKTAPYKLKPVKREIMRRAMEMHKQALQKEEEKVLEEASLKKAEKEKTGFFLTEYSQATDRKPREETKNVASAASGQQEKVDEDARAANRNREEKHLWDEYLLSILSRPTAQWIVTQRTDVNDTRYKPLYDYMVTKHGVPSSTELVRDDMADYEDKPKPKPAVKEVVKRPNTQSARLLRPVHEMEERENEEELDTVPYSDKNMASFYRKPGGIKKRMKIQQKEMAENAIDDGLDKEPGALNTTATSITVKKQELPPPPKIRDFVDPRITENTVYETDNNFQRDWLTGNQQVYQVFGDDNEIVMENHNKYTKVYQTQYPRDSGEWCPQSVTQQDGGNGFAKSPTNLVHKKQLGQKRWTDLPKSLEDSTSMIAGVVEEVEQSMGSSTEKFQPSEALSRIVDEWRAKWHLNMRFDDATPEELIKDMEDIHPHVRIKAISTCARAATYKPPPLEGIQLYSVKQSEKTRLPEKIFVALNCLLGDEHQKVQLAAAISLHALERPNEKAEEVLRRNLLPEQNKADRWAAVQCLGFYGVTDSDVVGECVSQMMNNEDMVLYEKACKLLSHISNNTDTDGQNLVHSMLAEHLNDCSWRHRVMALKCLPKLYGDINIDIQNKVMHLMWNDSHSDVRKAAAQSLGKCGYGRLVHDKLRQILVEGTQTERAETLSKIGFLGIMTAKLMLPFMKTFRDEYVTVRKEACIAAGNLRIRDENLIAELLRLANRDPIWRIKALAIQALGKIGVATPEVRDALLWALRFEEEEGVRAESCHSIILLQLKDTEVLEILQNRMLVEESPIVQEELAVALEFNGVSATEDMAMVAQIKAEVRKLSNRNDIYNSICELEQEEQLADNTKAMIYLPPAPKTPVDFPTDEVEENVALTAEQVAKHQEGVVLPRPVSQSMKTYTSVSEAIIEVDEDLPEEEKEAAVASAKQSRQASAASKASRSQHTSAKSRPVSGGSSLFTDVADTELENVMSKRASREELTDFSGSRASPLSAREHRESLGATGYEKKILSQSRAVSVTPTVLSVAMDQIEAMHSTHPSVADRMKTMSVHSNEQDGNMYSGASLRSSPDMDPHSHASSVPPQLLNAEHSITKDNDQSVKIDLPKINSKTLTPVQACRFESTSYLMDRYSHIDIKSPDEFSPLPADDITR